MSDARHQNFGPVRAVAYANWPKVVLHRAVLRALLDNRERGSRLRLPLTDLAAAVDRLGVSTTMDQLSAALGELEEIKVVESMQNLERVRTAAELRHNHLSYDITSLGERCEQFFDELEGLVEAVGSLDVNRLIRIHMLLGQLALALRRGELEPQSLQSAFTELHAQFEGLRSGAQEFMRDLSATMASNEAIDEEGFTDYKRKVADYLNGFWRELGQHADAIASHVAEIRLDSARETATLQAIASLSVAPHPTLSDEQVLERQLAVRRRQWAEICGWFGAGDSQMRSLDAHLHAAIDWILRGLRRLRERQVQRISRATEYRALAAMFVSAADEHECHAIYAAAFGLFGARHVSVPEADPDLASAGLSWWDAPAAPVQGYLRRPGRGETAVGRVPPIPDSAGAHRLALQEELRRHALVAALLARMPAGPTRLSALPPLEVEAFDLVLDALGQALAGPSGAGPALGFSDDGTLQLEVFDLGEGQPPGRVRCGDGGLLEAPDFLLQISSTDRAEAVIA
jgi:uncharacterized protein (TIGR02677 family)